MSKAILMSIKPKWCELIASGKKTVEVRKTRPKIETPFKVYIYATWNGSSREILVKDSGTLFVADYRTPADRASGKVIGEFVCDSIDQYDYDYCPHPEIGMNYDCGDSWWEIADEDLENACLTYEDFKKYAWRQEVMYGWHISDLVIYDKPKELSEFYQKCKSYDKDEWENDDCLECENPCGNGGKLYLKRPPQSWCYVEEGR